MEFDRDVKEKWIVEIFQRRQHDYRLIDGCFHKDFKVFLEATIYEPITIFQQSILFAEESSFKVEVIEQDQT